MFEGGDENLYGYVMNDPVNLIDPSGLFVSSNEKEMHERLIEAVDWWTYRVPLEKKRNKKLKEEERRFMYPPVRTPIQPRLAPPFWTTPSLEPEGGMCE